MENNIEYMIHFTQEEIRDEVLSLFEEHEDELISQASQMEKIEADAISSFDINVIKMKNRLLNDIAVPEEQLQKQFLEELENIRKSTLEEVQVKIKELLEKQKEVVR